MAKNIDVFGFDELEKAFKRCEKNYPNRADAFLMAEGQAVTKKTKALTPVYQGDAPSNGKIKPGQLKKSWQLKKVKLYKSGTVRVVRIQSAAPHAHLIERGHELVRGGKTRERGQKLNKVQRSARGIKSLGYVKGEFMLEKAMTEARSRFNSGAVKLLDSVTGELRI